MSKRGLGRGLEAIFAEMQVTETDVVTSIDLRDLRPNPYQPRRSFDEEKLEELAQSIQEHGIIQPLIVRRSSVRGYDIVAGERRYRAAQRLGMTSVPAVVRNFSDVQLMEIAIIENLQREDLNALEIADAYASLMEKCHLTQEELARRVGQSRSHVANMLRLLHLPERVKELVSRGTLSMGHARALLAVDDPVRQVELAEQVVREDLSVRKLEALIYRPKGQRASVSRETPAKPEQDVRYRRYEDMFRAYLGTAVHIRAGKKRGKIEIEYFSADDLERIVQLLIAHLPQPEV